MLKFGPLALAAALTLTTLVPTAASAQALDTASGTQAWQDLSNEVVHSSAMRFVAEREPQSRYACDPVDPQRLGAAEADLNAFDQRATALANATSGGVHVHVMALVRVIETDYYELVYPLVPDRCYVAPGA